MNSIEEMKNETAASLQRHRKPERKMKVQEHYTLYKQLTRKGLQDYKK